MIIDPARPLTEREREDLAAFHERSIPGVNAARKDAKVPPWGTPMPKEDARRVKDDE